MIYQGHLLFFFRTIAPSPPSLWHGKNIDNCLSISNCSRMVDNADIFLNPSQNLTRGRY